MAKTMESGDQAVISANPRKTAIIMLRWRDALSSGSFPAASSVLPLLIITPSSGITPKFSTIAIAWLPKVNDR